MLYYFPFSAKLLILITAHFYLITAHPNLTAKDELNSDSVQITTVPVYRNDNDIYPPFLICIYYNTTPTHKYRSIATIIN